MAKDTSKKTNKPVIPRRAPGMPIERPYTSRSNPLADMFFGSITPEMVAAADRVEEPPVQIQQAAIVSTQSLADSTPVDFSALESTAPESTGLDHIPLNVESIITPVDSGAVSQPNPVIDQNQSSFLINTSPVDFSAPESTAPESTGVTTVDKFENNYPEIPSPVDSGALLELRLNNSIENVTVNTETKLTPVESGAVDSSEPTNIEESVSGDQTTRVIDVLEEEEQGKPEITALESTAPDSTGVNLDTSIIENIKAATGPVDSGAVDSGAVKLTKKTENTHVPELYDRGFLAVPHTLLDRILEDINHYSAFKVYLYLYRHAFRRIHDDRKSANCCLPIAYLVQHCAIPNSVVREALKVLTKEQWITINGNSGTKSHYTVKRVINSRDTYTATPVKSGGVEKSEFLALPHNLLDDIFYRIPHYSAFKVYIYLYREAFRFIHDSRLSAPCNLKLTVLNKECSIPDKVARIAVKELAQDGWLEVISKPGQASQYIVNRPLDPTRLYLSDQDRSDLSDQDRDQSGYFSTAPVDSSAVDLLTPVDSGGLTPVNSGAVTGESPVDSGAVGPRGPVDSGDDQRIDLLKNRSKKESSKKEKPDDDFLSSLIEIYQNLTGNIWTDKDTEIVHTLTDKIPIEDLKNYIQVIHARSSKPIGSFAYFAKAIVKEQESPRSRKANFQQLCKIVERIRTANTGRSDYTDSDFRDDIKIAAARSGIAYPPDLLDEAIKYRPQ